MNALGRIIWDGLEFEQYDEHDGQEYAEEVKPAFNFRCINTHDEI